MKNADKLNRFLRDFSLSDKNAPYILAAIIVLSFLLRVYTLDSESLWHDEIYSINAAKGTIMSMLDITVGDTHPPFHYIILHYWMGIFGDGEISTRFLSVIYGTLSIYVIYRLGNLMYNREIGIISAFMLSISLYSIKYSQEVRSYSLMILLILLSNYYFIKTAKEKDTNSYMTRYRVGYILSTVTMIYTHIFGLFYVIFQNIYYLLICRKNIKTLVITQVSILTLFSFWIPTLVKQMYTKDIGGISWIPVPNIDSIYYVLGVFSGGETMLFFFIAICIFGMVILYKQERLYGRNNKVFLLMWLFIPIILSFVVSLTVKPIFYDRYLISSLPALVLLVSSAVFSFRKTAIILILLVSIVLVAIPSITAYYQGSEKEQWREVASYIQDNRHDGDAVVFYTTYGLASLNYYYKDNSNFYGINGSYEIKNNIRKNKGIWLVTTETWLKSKAEESELVKETLSKTHTKKNVVGFIDVEVSYYEKLDTNVLYLYQKNMDSWRAVKGGSSGVLNYDLIGFDINFTFDAYKLDPNVNYTLLYTCSAYKNDNWTYVTSGKSNSGGNLNIAESSRLTACTDVKYDNIEDSKGIKMILVPSSDYNVDGQSITSLNATKYLFEDDLIYPGVDSVNTGSTGSNARVTSIDTTDQDTYSQT